MKAVFILCALVVAVSARPDEKYTSKYDDLNYQEMVMNPRVVGNFMKCLLSTGKCTEEAKLLRTLIPDALQNKCAKCTDKQKEGTEFVIDYLMKNYPEYWQQLRDKFDPENKYVHTYKKELEKLSS